MHHPVNVRMSAAIRAHSRCAEDVERDRDNRSGSGGYHGAEVLARHREASSSYFRVQAPGSPASRQPAGPSRSNLLNAPPGTCGRDTVKHRFLGMRWARPTTTQQRLLLRASTVDGGGGLPWGPALHSSPLVSASGGGRTPPCSTTATAPSRPTRYLSTRPRSTGVFRVWPRTAGDVIKLTDSGVHFSPNSAAATASLAVCRPTVTDQRDLFRGRSQAAQRLLS